MDRFPCETGGDKGLDRAPVEAHRQQRAPDVKGVHGSVPSLNLMPARGARPRRSMSQHPACRTAGPSRDSSAMSIEVR